MGTSFDVIPSQFHMFNLSWIYRMSSPYQFTVISELCQLMSDTELLRSLFFFFHGFIRNFSNCI